MKTKIYGGSDDLIEIEGGGIDEEANIIDAKNVSILCSDNTKATITYDDNGEWKISVLVEGEKFLSLIHSVGDDKEHFMPDAERCTSYSDVLVLDEGIKWVKIGRKKYKAE